MAIYNKNSIRNIALIGHSGEGKTSLMEALLFEMKAIDRLGKVDDGSSVSDYDQEEIAKKMSISLSLGYGIYNNTKINIIDVPGFFDFEGEMVAALTVAEAAIIVTSATGNLTVGTEKALDYCKEHKIPAMIYVNGVNKENSNYIATVEAIKAKYGTYVEAIELPIMSGYNMQGAVKLLDNTAVDLKKATIAIPADLQASAEGAIEKLAEMAAESSEELMEKFFEEGALSADEIKTGVKTRVIAAEFVPVVAGAATLNLGTNLLLDNVVNLLPSPAEGKDAAKMDAEGKVAVQVFKTIVDQFVGKLNIVKVFSGTLKASSVLVNGTTEEKERINQLYILKGKKQENTDELSAGDIGALAKLSNTNTNDVLYEEGTPFERPAIEFPAPVISMAVYAAKEGEEEKIFTGLSRLHEEDPTFSVEKAVDTAETVISGQGEAQLEILCRKLKNKFGCNAVLKEPKISYRETIKGIAEAEGKHKKQSGGAGQFGVVYVKFEPGAADGEFEFVDAVVGGAVPRQFIPVVEKGLRDATKHGVLAGYPVVNLKATLFDGKYHPVDSKEVAFLSAAKLSYEAALPMAKPILLEPIMAVKVIIPEAYLGDIMSDMNKRRGRIFGMDLVDGKQVVNGEAPMAELAKYATDLRSMTQGRGKFTMEFVRYEEVPASAAEKIIADSKKA